MVTATATITAIPTGIRMTTTDPALRLQSWFSPAFPIGAFSYSHGLEPLIEDGAVRDRESLIAAVETLLGMGSGRVDAAFFAAAWRSAPDAQTAADLALEASAWIPTAELTLESEQQGDAFLQTVSAAWPHPGLTALSEALPERPPLSVAAGFACAVHGASLETALPLFLQAFAVNLVSAGVRLVPLGQTDGQIATARLEGAVAAAAAIAIADGFDSAWTTTPAHDIHSMRHETQYARIFRS